MTRMTREEAAEILDGRNIVGRAAYLEALEVAANALCESAALRADAPPPNAPLTMEELREMDGQPVYLAIDHKWYVVNLNYWGPGGNRELCGVDMWGNGTSLSLLAECGLYRRKPEEGTE